MMKKRLLFTGCLFFSFWWLSPGCVSVLNELGFAPTVKVPLTNFKATDGHYFPDFIQKFFQSVRMFSAAKPHLSEARQGMQLIEVKQLNEENLPFNEANLSWSADGVYLGFEVVTNKNRKILVKDLVGNYSKELLVMPKGSDNFLEGMVQSRIQSYNAGLRWSKDSTRFSFMSNGGIGEYNIYVGAIGVKETPIAKNQTKDGYATWSPVSNEIAFVSARSGNGDIYLVNLLDKTLTRLSDLPGVDLFPEWFPDGSKIVFSSGDSLNHDLYVTERAVDGIWKKPHLLIDWTFDDLRPIVSPDGKYMAFYADSGPNNDPAGDEQRIWNIHMIPITADIYGKTYTARELENMVVAKDVVIDLTTGPSWTPDSRKIFYVKRDPDKLNPIYGYDLFEGERYYFKTGTKMNHDILMSRLGVLSFRAQSGVWDRVFVALTNQGTQLQPEGSPLTQVHYEKL